MRTRLNRQITESASPKASRYIIWDSELSGFGLRIEPSGSRSWIIKYRAGQGRSAPSRWLVIGRYPVLSSIEARKAAAKTLAEARLGNDPASARAAKRREMTVAKFIEL